ncbi:MAG: DNA topoisomerase III [Bacteroidales bacterium]|jgi:DNA topoisomerase-3|nr:DNA topoisomerase III [Bacteroidales bacterium]
MKLIITEKPSVGRSIAAIVGACNKKDGYLEGGGYIVSWAFGHLCGLQEPEDYKEEWKDKNRRENLPMFPDEFKIKASDDKGAKHQLKVLKELFARKDADTIINAGDAGREGELIQRYIYSFCGGLTMKEKKMLRLWISSLTDKALKDGLSNLRPASEFDNLYYAGKARSEADWLVGMNASRALTIAAHSSMPVGRVMTPTLAMICQRFIDNRDFKSVPFWNVLAATEKAGVNFVLTLPVRYMNSVAATAMKEKINNVDTFEILNVTRGEKKEQPPLLFDLTGLQKLCSSRLSLPADETLAIAQKLYENKYITYPRTGSSYISEDIFVAVGELITSAAKLWGLTGTAIPPLSSLSRRSVNNEKVTDHHALLPTIIKPDIDSLSKMELAVYKVICVRMLEAFHTPCIKDIVKATIDVGGEKCTVNGAVIREAGWRGVQGVHKSDEKKDSDTDTEQIAEQQLPPLTEGDILPNKGVSVKEGKTQPPPLLTDASLLALMETAGKECADDSEREAMKECGLGTPATRAATIDKLLKRGQIERKVKKLIPTEKGLSIYAAVKDMKIASSSLTGQWEKVLADVEHGKMQYSTFINGIKKYTTELVNDMLNADIEYHSPQQQIAVALPACPKCKKEKLTVFTTKKCTVMKCTCGFILWGELFGKKLKIEEMIEFLEKGNINIHGFKSKSGKKYNGILSFNADFKVTMGFDK